MTADAVLTLAPAMPAPMRDAMSKPMANHASVAGIVQANANRA